MDIEQIQSAKDWSELLYEMSRGDVVQYEMLKTIDEVEFYHILKKHEERMKFEAEHPQLRF